MRGSRLREHSAASAPLRKSLSATASLCPAARQRRRGNSDLAGSILHLPAQTKRCYWCYIRLTDLTALSPEGFTPMTVLDLFEMLPMRPSSGIAITPNTSSASCERCVGNGTVYITTCNFVTPYQLM